MNLQQQAAQETVQQQQLHVTCQRNAGSRPAGGLCILPFSLQVSYMCWCTGNTPLIHVSPHAPVL